MPRLGHRWEDEFLLRDHATARFQKTFDHTIAPMCINGFGNVSPRRWN